MKFSPFLVCWYCCGISKSGVVVVIWGLALMRIRCTVRAILEFEGTSGATLAGSRSIAFVTIVLVVSSVFLAFFFSLSMALATTSPAAFGGWLCFFSFVTIPGGFL